MLLLILISNFYKYVQVLPALIAQKFNLREPGLRLYKPTSSCQWVMALFETICFSPLSNNLLFAIFWAMIMQFAANLLIIILHYALLLFIAMLLLLLPLLSVVFFCCCCCVYHIFQSYSILNCGYISICFSIMRKLLLQT